MRYTIIIPSLIIIMVLSTGCANNQLALLRELTRHDYPITGVTQSGDLFEISVDRKEGE